ncbi:hypothetical protein PAPYR_7943 [Paratrimastix pyriformis]|uniref:Cadherin-like beta-sandwich-like domain-containing protein n=1 Tax=Paratrimastix pyriformis TaxID=342808 RepID=A0ABQ8UBR7_9EUKA|nr:hypothetical protein PAPYR_7943 [Paratrimastix pyriformis]
MRGLLFIFAALAFATASEFNVRWSHSNGAFFFSAQEGKINPHLINLDAVAGLTELSCQSAIGTMSLLFSSQELAAQFSGSLVAGYPLSSQKFVCADGAIPNVIFVGDLVLEKERVSFTTVRATVKDLFTTASVRFSALRPTTLLSLHKNATATALDEYPLVQQAFAMGESMPAVLRDFLDTGSVPQDPISISGASVAIAQGQNYDHTWTSGTKSVSRSVDLYGSKAGALYVGADASASMQLDVSFSFDTHLAKPTLFSIVVSGDASARVVLNVALQKQWSYNFRQKLASLSLINPSPSFSIACPRDLQARLLHLILLHFLVVTGGFGTGVTFKLDCGIEFGVGGSLSFDGQAKSSVGVSASGSLSAGVKWTSGNGFSFPRSAAFSASLIGPTFSGKADTTGTLYLYARPQFSVGDSNPWVDAHLELQTYVTATGTYRSSGGACSAKQVKVVASAGLKLLAGYYVKFIMSHEESIEPMTLKSWSLYNQCVTLPGLAAVTVGASSPAPTRVLPAIAAATAGPFMLQQAAARGLAGALALADGLALTADASPFVFGATGTSPVTAPAQTVQFEVPMAGDWAVSAALRGASGAALVYLQQADSSVMPRDGTCFSFVSASQPARASLRLTGLSAGTKIELHVGCSQPAAGWLVDLVAIPVSAATQDTLFIDPISGSEDLADPAVGTEARPFSHAEDAWEAVFSLPTTLVFLPGNHTIHNSLALAATGPSPLVMTSLTGAASGYASALDTVLDAQFSSRILRVSRGAVLAVRGLGFTHGHVTGEDGGAAYLEAATSSFTDCVFTENSAIGNMLWGSDVFDAYGGAVVVRHGTASFSGCVFSHNVGNFGGALATYAYGAANITGCTFDHNLGTLGGALYSWIRDLLVESCVFTENQAMLKPSDKMAEEGWGNYGGAVALDSVPLYQQSTRIVGSLFEGNSAEWGGGVYINNDITSTAYPFEVDISLCQFRQNHVWSVNTSSLCCGGALAAWSALNNVEVKVDQSTFTENTAQARGGAVCMEGPVSLTMSQSSIANNKALPTTFGGALLYQSVGGALYCNSCLADVEDVIITGNGFNDLTEAYDIDSIHCVGTTAGACATCGATNACQRCQSGSVIPLLCDDAPAGASVQCDINQGCITTKIATDPRIDTIEPSEVPMEGGTVLQLTGYFGESAAELVALQVGGAMCAPFRWIDSIVLSAGTLSPEFQPGLRYYEATTSGVASLQLTATPTAPGAAVAVNGEASSVPVPLRDGANVVYINVTAADGVSTAQYMVFVRAAVPAADATGSKGLIIGLSAGLGGGLLVLAAVVPVLVVALVRSRRAARGAAAASPAAGPAAKEVPLQANVAHATSA